MARLWLWSLLVVCLPGSPAKCIFDEVQSSVPVITATPTDSSQPFHLTGSTGSTGKHLSQVSDFEARAGHSPANPDQRSSQPHHTSVSKRLSREHKEQAQPSSDPPQPIRIRIWVPRESPDLSQLEKERLEPAVKEAVGVVSTLLSVTRVPGPLLLSRNVNKYCKFIWRNTSAANHNRCGRANENYRTESCLDVIIPDDHLSGSAVYPGPDSPMRTVLRPEGMGLPDTDFLLYLHTESTDKCRAEPTVLAYAVHCQTNSQGRPLAGVVVICTDTLRGETYSHFGTVQTVVHELFHALGFSKQLFSTWRDCSHSSKAGCSRWGQVTNIDDAGQMRIYTQSVISALQNHLASSDPALGGPLENLDAGPGGVSSHWEARVLQSSIMTAVLADPAVVRIDPVTLAALQDTGWYFVNLSQAQNLVWGEGEGVLFGSLSTCNDTSSSFFCSGSGSGCHYFHLHKGECQSDQYLDGCRIYKPLIKGSECWKEENGRETKTRGLSDEIYSLDSRCFFSNLSKESLSWSGGESVEGRCYRHRCIGPNQYQVQVNGPQWLDCPAGGIIENDLWKAVATTGPMTTNKYVSV
ncbi:ciliated left-right organizer metallopeptidase [Aplochiton taeniatus]